MAEADLGREYHMTRIVEEMPLAGLSTRKHLLLPNAHAHLGIEDDVDTRETKRRRQEDGYHPYDVDIRKASPPRPGPDPHAGTSMWPSSYAPGIHHADHRAQHNAGPSAGWDAQRTGGWPPDKSSPVQYVDPFGHSTSRSGGFGVAGPSTISPGSFTAPAHWSASSMRQASSRLNGNDSATSDSIFSPAALQWHPGAVTPHPCSGPERTAADLAPSYSTQEGNLHAESLSSSEVYLGPDSLPSPDSTDDYRRHSSAGAYYHIGYQQSPFSPSSVDSSNVFPEPSPFPRTPSDATFPYLMRGRLSQRNQATNLSPELGIHAAGMDFSFPPISTAKSSTADALAPGTLPSPPSDDGTEVNLPNSSPPDLGERSGMAASRQGERHFGEVESLGLTRRHEEIVSTTPVLSGGYTGPSQAPNPGPEATGSEATGRGKKVRKQRGKIEQSVKERICKTRKMGACLRCHNQRAKCEPNEADPENPLLPCKTCDNVNKMSGKTIHNLPCLRGKITTIELYRRGGLPYTTRFSHEMLQDVPGYGEIHTVFMTSGLVRTPVRLEIRLFHPNSTDLLDRHYLHNGVPKKVKLPPFCLVDIKKTSEEFADYINAHAFDGLLEAVKGQNIIIRETFKMIAKQCNALPENVTAKGKGGQNTQEPNKQKELLRAAVRLWFSIRHGIGSSTLCGERPQGMEPIHDPDSYFEGEVPGIPRMIVAQFDSIRHERIYKDLAPHVLRLLEGVFTMKNMEAWFTGYLVTFLFLDLVSSASEDRRRWARDNSEGKRMESRYGPVSGKLARFVQDLHMAGAILLQSWHYYKRMDLWNTGWDDPKKDKPLKSLKLEEVEFLKWTVGEMKLEVEGNKFPKTPSDGCWEHPMFWISQMFTSFSKTDYKWAAPEVFACERPSVGRELDLSA